MESLVTSLTELAQTVNLITGGATARVEGKFLNLHASIVDEIEREGETYDGGRRGQTERQNMEVDKPLLDQG